MRTLPFGLLLTALLVSAAPPTVAAPAPTRVTIASSPAKVVQHRPAKVVGAVSPASPRRAVQLEIAYQGAWRPVRGAMQRLDGRSRYAFAVPTRATGTYSYRVVAPAVPGKARGVSPTLRLRVQPPPPTAAPPSAVALGSASFTGVTARRTGSEDPTEVSVRVTWQQPTSGGVPEGYDLRRSVVDQAGTATVLDTQRLTATTLDLRVATVDAGSSRYRWEVRAVNRSGASAWSELQAGITDLRGQSGQDATQMIRTSGAFVRYQDGGTTRPPSREQAYRVYGQSPATATVAPGSFVDLSYYGAA